MTVPSKLSAAPAKIPSVGNEQNRGLFWVVSSGYSSLTTSFNNGPLSGQGRRKNLNKAI